MERCREHIRVDGGIERSIKKNNLVERTRRCRKCGGLFKTFEMTDDQVAEDLGKHDEDIRVLKVELAFYRRVIGDVQKMYQVEELVKDGLRAEYEFSNEGGS